MKPLSKVLWLSRKPAVLLLAVLLVLMLPSRTRGFSSPAIAAKMEETVRRYFAGVEEKDASKIRSCFGETATIRDVCGINNDERTVKSEDLVDRCMEFVAAHPDVAINFYYGPECGRASPWVVAHWYETGTWSGYSCGVPAPNPPLPMAVEGQTRFRVDAETFTIQELVVTRTFTEWEQQMLQLRSQQQQQQLHQSSSS